MTCPLCNAPTKDKGSHDRCTECEWYCDGLHVYFVGGPRDGGDADDEWGLVESAGSWVDVDGHAYTLGDPNIAYYNGVTRAMPTTP